jgi:regulator of protease activity HflC (stomatin/prohibitin superfamily)
MESFIVFLLLLVVFVIITGIRIVKQYERGVILTLGKYTGTRNPGLNVIIPVVQQMEKVDMRLATVDIPRQEVITKDNVTVSVDAVVYFRVTSAEKATLDVQNFRLATAQYAQAALRDVVGKVELDTLLSERDQISSEIRTIVDAATEPWGIDVPDVNIQNVELPNDMKRVIGKQAEAEREKRSVIVKARGELEASQNLADAAQKLSSTPGALHLRTLSTLNDLSSDQSNTVIFAIPLEVLRAFEKYGDGMDLKNMAAKVVNHGKKEQ